jgi:heme exporter protein D
MMNWQSWSDFLAMGGYGVYVWGSYGVTLVLMALEVALLFNRKRTAREQLRPGTAGAA